MVYFFLINLVTILPYLLFMIRRKRLAIAKKMNAQITQLRVSLYSQPVFRDGLEIQYMSLNRSNFKPHILAREQVIPPVMHHQQFSWNSDEAVESNTEKNVNGNIPNSVSAQHYTIV